MSLFETVNDAFSTARPRRRQINAMPASVIRLAGSAFILVAPWAALLALWIGVRHSGLIKPGLVPSPLEVLDQAWSHLQSGALLGHLAASTLRVAAGVAIGSALAIPVGFLIGRSPQVRALINPLINFFRALPPIALIPLIIVYFGIGESAKITVLAFAAFFASVIVLYEGIGQIAPIYVHVAKTLGATEREIFARVIFPLALPHILTALRVALGVTWATLVAAELIAAQVGLGAMIQVAASFFQLDIIYLGIISIGVAALTMDFALRRLSAHLVVWQERLHP